MSIGSGKWRIILFLALCGYGAVFAAGFTFGKQAAVKEHRSTFITEERAKSIQNGIYILAGAFAKKEKAIQLVKRLKENGYRAIMVDKTKDLALYRVLVGPVEEKSLKKTLLTLQRQEKIIGYTVSYAKY